jgi:DNA-directed RNA polymerase subunit omega
MMLIPPIEELLTKVENRFSLCVLTSKRARQLIQGASTAVDVDTERVVAVAIDEIKDGKVGYAYR